MRAQGLAWRRSRAQAGLLAASFGTVAVLAALAVGTLGSLESGAVNGVRGVLSDAGSRGGAIQFSARLSPDSAAQDTAAASAIETAIGSTHLSWSRSVQSSPQPAVVAGAETGTPPEEFSIVLGADEAAADRVELVTGEWPTASNTGALQLDAAAALGLEAGDQIAVGDDSTPLEIVGTWRALDPNDPIWLGDPLAGAGSSDEAFGILFTSEETLAGLGTTPFARWTIIPDLDAIVPGELEAIGIGLSRLTTALEESDEFNTSGVVSAGTLPETVAQLRASLAAVGGISPVPLVLIGLVGLIALAQLARLLRSVRTTETALARARGASIRQLLVLDTGETIALAVPAALFGGGLAILALSLAPGGVDGLSGSLPSLLLVASSVALLAVATTAITTLAGARVALARGDDSGRASRTLTLGATTLLVIAAAVSLWQFRLYGAGQNLGAGGLASVDPLTVLAPALGLVALCMLGLLAFAPLATAIERLATRGPGILPALPARQLARRLVVFAVAVVLIALAAGGATFAAAYSGTWNALDRANAELRAGAAVRVSVSGSTLVGGPSTLLAAPLVADLPGVRGAAPVLSGAVKIGQEPATFTAIAAGSLASVAASADGRIDTAALAALIEVGPVGTPIPDAVESLTATVALAAPPGFERGEVALSLLVQDAGGAAVRLPLGTLALASSDAVAFTAALPAGNVPWSILGLDAELSGSDGAKGVLVELESLRSDADSAQLDFPAAPLSLSWEDPTQRMLAFDPAALELPLVLSEALADKLGAEIGDSFDFAFVGTGRSGTGVVTGVAPLLPGTASTFGVLSNLPAFTAAMAAESDDVGRATQLWIASDSPAGTARAASEQFGTRASIISSSSASSEALVRPAIVALWIGAAGSVVLATLALFAISVALVGARRGEVIVLRAVGMTAGEQARARQLELIAVAVIALVFGVCAGLATAALTVGELARAAVGAADGLSPRIAIDGVPFAGALCGLLLAVALVAWGYARSIRRQANDTERREETR